MSRFALLLAAIALGCTSSAENNRDTPPCAPGDTRNCVGPGSCSGAQVCGANNTWSTCDCGAGTGGVGGSSGAAGSSGGTGGNPTGGTSGTGATGGVAGGGGASGAPGTGGTGTCNRSTASDCFGCCLGKHANETVPFSEAFWLCACGSCQSECACVSGVGDMEQPNCSSCVTGIDTTMQGCMTSLCAPNCILSKSCYDSCL